MENSGNTAEKSRGSSSKEHSSQPGDKRRSRRSRSPPRRRRRNHRGRSRDRSRERRSSRSSARAGDGDEFLTEEEAKKRDAHCVFVSQLQVKATEEDVEFYFSSFCNVAEVALIKEKSTGRSKGFGYVEFATMEDVNKALMLSGLPFVWRDGTKGFPLTVRPSEAHKLYLESQNQTSIWTSVAAQTQAQKQQIQNNQMSSQAHQNIELIKHLGPGSAEASIDGGPPVILPTIRGKPLNTRLLYVGNLDKGLTEKDLREVFGAFGPIENIQLKVDPNTGQSKGFAFVKYKDTSYTATANEKLNGYELMGLTLTCNPVNDKYNNQRDQDDVFDDDERGGSKLGANRRVQLMTKLAGGAAQELISAVPILHQSMSRTICITNMFDPTTETAPNWAEEIERDTKEECERHGAVISCVVDRTNSIGQVTVTFQNPADASRCADSLQGRWFGERQVRVNFV